MKMSLTAIMKIVIIKTTLLLIIITGDNDGEVDE